MCKKGAPRERNTHLFGPLWGSFWALCRHYLRFLAVLFWGAFLGGSRCRFWKDFGSDWETFGRLFSGLFGRSAKTKNCVWTALARADCMSDPPGYLLFRSPWPCFFEGCFRSASETDLGWIWGVLFDDVGIIFRKIIKKAEI